MEELESTLDNLKDLFAANRQWAKELREKHPDFFSQLAEQQKPELLWIGCSDSRVPAEVLINRLPGELFLHRNVANMVVHTDLNCLSVIQYAVDVLKIKHVIVCGHYGCGGVLAALEDRRVGLIDNWLQNIKDVFVKHRQQFQSLEQPEDRHARLCELNVLEQVVNVCETTVVQDAWERGQPVSVHGWIYCMSDGLLRDLGINASSNPQLRSQYPKALDELVRSGPGELPPQAF